jgi:hypothetical protein
MKLATKLAAWLRKGFGYVLLSMGVSRPGTRGKPAPESGRRPEHPG